MFSVRGNKKGANWKPKKGVQRLPEHSEQVQGKMYRLNRCSVFGEIKKEAIWTPKEGVQRLPEHNKQVFKELSTVNIGGPCLGK